MKGRRDEGRNKRGEGKRGEGTRREGGRGTRVLEERERRWREGGGREVICDIAILSEWCLANCGAVRRLIRIL